MVSYNNKLIIVIECRQLIKCILHISTYTVKRLTYSNTIIRYLSHHLLPRSLPRTSLPRPLPQPRPPHLPSRQTDTGLIDNNNVAGRINKPSDRRQRTRLPRDAGIRCPGSLPKPMTKPLITQHNIICFRYRSYIPIQPPSCKKQIHDSSWLYNYLHVIVFIEFYLKFISIYTMTRMYYNGFVILVYSAFSFKGNEKYFGPVTSNRKMRFSGTARNTEVHVFGLFSSF